LGLVGLFRRFEFLVVAGFLLAGAGYVVLVRQMNRRGEAPAEVRQVVLDPAKAGPAGESGEAQAEAALPFAITGTTWEEVDGHWLLELRVRYRNEAGAEAVLEEPVVRLVTGDGEPVEPFFLATAEPPRVAAGAEETVGLRYWMGPDRAKEPLWLRVGEDRTRVDPPGPGA
jgi:hypothetical protein